MYVYVCIFYVFVYVCVCVALTMVAVVAMPVVATSCAQLFLIRYDKMARCSVVFFTKYDDSGALFLMPIVLVNTINLVLCLLSPF